MKALEDAIAASTTAERLQILKTLAPKEYPTLLKSAEEARQHFGQEISATYQHPREEWDARLEVVYQKMDCLDLAEMMASLTKKKLVCQPRGEVLLCPEIFNLLAASPSAWLPKLILGSSVEVILRYSNIESIPRPPEGDSYYEKLAEHIFVQGEGMADGIKRFLRDNPVILEKDVHVMIRLMARKQGVNRLNVDLNFAEGRSRLSDPYLGHEVGIRFAKAYTGEILGAFFPLIAAAGPLFSDGDFKIQPILRTILETLTDVQRELEARNVLDVHDQLSPAPEQCLKLQNDYFVLLSSPHKAVTRFAIDMIDRFAGLKGFDAEMFAARVDAIFSHASNPLQIAGLKLVRNVAKHHSKIASQIPAKTACGLLNPDPKVQAAILEVLEALPVSTQKKIPEAISPFANHVIPSLRFAFEKWLGKAQLTLIPIQVPSGEFPTVLGTRLTPLKSADELPFLASELLSKQPDPMRLELFLDGLARFAAVDRLKLAKAFGVMEARARHVVIERGRNGDHPSWVEVLTSSLILHFGSDPSVLVAASLDFSAPPDTSVWPAAVGERGAVGRFASSRIAELVHGIDHGRASQPLATPEFAHGFIGSETLVARLRALLDLGTDPMHFDFIQAIARCHPSGQEIPIGMDEASRVLRYRLTGKLDGPIGKPAWWLAAARAREPGGDFSGHPQFSEFHVEGQSDWTSPAFWRDPATIGFGEFDGLNARKYISWSDPNRREDLLYDHDKIPADHLYPLQHALVWPDPFVIRWRYSFTPGFLDAVIAEDIHHTFYMWSATGRKYIDSAAAVMGELATRRPPLRHTMQFHLLLALSSSGQAEREAAMDIFLQASEDGRLAEAVSGLGVILRQLLESGPPRDEPVLQLGRVTPLLRLLSTYGPLIQTQLRDLILTALERPLSGVPKGFPNLLELLLDLVTAHPPARKVDLNATWSGRLDGKSKTLAARIAKACHGRTIVKDTVVVVW